MASLTLRPSAAQQRQSPLGRAALCLVAALLALASTGRAQAQTHTVTGQVTSQQGETLPGVNIIVKGQSTGTASDLDGRYTLTAPSANDTLVFSFVGFRSQEVGIDGRSTVDAVLQEDVSALGEVLVVGYGTQTRNDLTGSVTSVQSSEVSALPLARVSEALQGRAAGVQVMNTDAQPGGNVRVRIRGGTSIQAGSDPLYVIDGYAGGNINMINPDDIASIQILKDASATAIYGARGANGVIIVSTKKGKPGRTQVEFKITPFSAQQVSNKIEVLNAREFAEYINEVRKNDGAAPKYTDVESLGEGTNHLDAILRDATLREYKISASGGSEKARFYVSGDLFDQSGIIINSGYTRYSFRSNLDFFVNDRMQVGANLTAARIAQDGTRVNSGGGALDVPATSAALRFNPILPIRDANGKYTINDFGDPSDNAYAITSELTQETRNDNLMGSAYAEYDLTKSLTLNVRGGVDIGNGRYGFYDPSVLYSGGGVGGSAQLQFNRNTNLINENYLSYRHTFGGVHNVSTQAGFSVQKNSYEYTQTNAQSFPTDAFSYYNLGAGSVLRPGASGLTDWNMESYYGRANYNYAERYLITFTARYDGSSRFARNNKYGFFPSGALAWNVHNEPFLQGASALNMLKLRASYGVTGNTEIGSYTSLAALGNQLTTIGGQIVNAIAPVRVGNDNLTWESTQQTNFGFDLGLFQDRVRFTTDYYVKNTSDLLLNVPLPLYSGFTTSLQNVGSTQNKGIEFELSTQNLTGKFKWDTDFNIAFNRNKVVELVRTSNDPNASNDIFLATGPGAMLLGNTSVLREGEPIGLFYGLIFEGVNPETGAEVITDLNGDGKINNEDRTVIGDPNPDYIWGLNNTMSYGGFDLNVFFQASVGNDLFNFQRLELEDVRGFYNQSKAVLNRWTPENRNTDIPKASSKNLRRVSSRWVEDGSFVRLRNLSLGYNLPGAFSSRLGVRTARILVSGQNLLTLTDYKGWDPEVNSRGGSNTQLGVDYGTYPRARSYTLSFNVGL